ncbi:SAP domain-containing ribonucleoprotein-like [Clytia hemisphaerica]|uniref:SAP domain-containing ribonucleoprotein-like n=1 Tax=Clytia hemisphaerica TaxID=252671 RepID=UPI0034D696DE
MNLHISFKTIIFIISFYLAFGGNKDDKDKPAGDKLSQRAARFGASVTSSNTTTTNKPSNGINTTSSTDKLKQRQERFLDEKLKKRQERFGAIQPTKPSNDMEARKQQRAMKFGIK